VALAVAVSAKDEAAATEPTVNTAAPRINAIFFMTVPNLRKNYQNTNAYSFHKFKQSSLISCADAEF